MNNHNEDDENQTNTLDNVEMNSDSDDGMEVDCADDSIDKLDSELVDSDVNVEATELTCSDVDLSDESDMKGDLTSDAESNVGQDEIDESAMDSDEQTFALEIKDAKDDSSDEKNDSEEVIRGNPSKNLTDAEDDEEEEEDEDDEDDDSDLKIDKKSMQNATSDVINELSDESLDLKNVGENVDGNSPPIAVQQDEGNEMETNDVEELANSESPTSTQSREHHSDTSNVKKSPALSKSESDLEDDTNEVNNSSPQREDVVSDDMPNFIGFDPEVTNRTLQIFYILQQNYQELLGQLQNVPDEDEDEVESPMEVDIEQRSQLTDTVAEKTASIMNEINVEDTSQDKQTDEQAAANKRIKKKRKFFDEFDESEMDPPKKTKEQRDSVSSMDVNMSENKENFMNSEKLPVNDELAAVVPAVPAAPLTIAPSTPIPTTKPETTKGKFDITNPDFKEPFKYGWRREVVYRYISEDGQKKSADVSYFTPQGKKLRSIKQINDNVPKDGSLTIKNFTFSKELIFRNRESELEVTRFTKKMEAELLTESPDVKSDHIIDRRLGIEPISTPTPLAIATTSPLSIGDESAKKAAVATSTTTPASSSKKKEPQKSKTNTKTTSLSHSSETAPKSKSSSKKGAKNTAEMDADENTNATPKLTMPKIMLRGPNVSNSNAAVSKVTSGKPSGMKIKIGPPPSKQSSQKTVKKASSSSSKSSKNSKSQKRADKSIAADPETSTVPATDWKTADRSSHAKSLRGTQTCSISCPLALGTIPTLQCTICLCSYHFECCGMDADRPAYGYVCKSCRMCERKKENVHPTYKTMRGSNHSPKGIYSTMADHYDSLTLSSCVAAGATVPATKIVDGVTTWLPSSSNIHLRTMSGGVLSMSNANAASLTTGGVSSTTSAVCEMQMPLAQGVLELDGRRYVVVPKQSVLSVSPNAATIFENHTALCERTTNTLARSGASSSIGVTAATSTLLVNPSDVNNAGVVLVPVVPSNNSIAAAYSPQHIPNSSSARYTAYANYDHRNRLKFPIENTCHSTYGFNCNSINGKSPNELSTYQMASNRAPAEYYSSFTLSNISRIYDPLLMSLKYLTVRDLLRISMTSKFLNRIASEQCLWKTVRLKNSQVHDWKGFAKALQKYGTKRLDMRKMLCSTVPEDLNKMWEEFLEVVPSITSLEHIDFSRTPMNVVDTVAATCPSLAVFNALYLKNGALTLDNFTRLQHLVELRLKGAGGIDLKRNEPQLHFINKDHLREISLTCIKNIDMDLLKMISEASNLVTLELGDCAKLPSDFAVEIGKLRKLEKLRLEKLENLAPDYELLRVVNGMEALKSLELINVEIKDGFDEVLAQCKNVENFLIIPLYISQSATTNQLVLDGIKSLSDTLKCFVWGLTTELLKVTDLFMDQWQPKSSSSGANNSGSNKKSGDSIPVRKLVDKPSSDGDVAPTHVDILPIPKLERILATHLPKSRIKVIKIPFQMTWRQSLSECLK